MVGYGLWDRYGRRCRVGDSGELVPHQYQGRRESSSSSLESYRSEESQLRIDKAVGIAKKLIEESQGKIDLWTATSTMNTEYTELRGDEYKEVCIQAIQIRAKFPRR